MKKILLLSFILATQVFATNVEIFFNDSTENELFCRIGYETYIKITHENAKIEKVNGSNYFHMKHQNRYIPISSCHPIKDEEDALIF